MQPEELLEGLTQPQREAVTHGDGPLLVLAGPGSGKTRVITHRAAYLAVTITEPRHILAITFTNKAANEMAERIAALSAAPGITCSTFHSFCARLLRIHADRAGLSPNFSIFDQADQVEAIKQAVDREGLATDNFPPRKILERISRTKNDMISVEQFEADAGDWPSRTIAGVYREYQSILTEQNALDFDDLLIRTAHLLGDDPELRNDLQARYRYVLVDEYQDTNHAQYLIARGLALDHENLCVTGDPDQSIYAWRGANLHNILEFEKDFRQAKVIRLEQNYRSTPQILSAADAVIAHNRKRKVKTLWTSNGSGPRVRVIEVERASHEADRIAEEIVRHAAEGGRYADVAVFYRVNALSRNIEESLRKQNVPYQVARGVAFYNRKEIKDVLAYLRVIANPQDRVALLRIINVPRRQIGDTTVQRILTYVDQTGKPLAEVIADPKQVPGIGRAAPAVRSFADLMLEVTNVAAEGSVRETIEFIVRNSGLEAMWKQAKDEDALANVNELISAAADYDRQHADGSGSTVGWLEQVSLAGDVDAIDPALGAVTLMTLHAAKGLEFDTVYIIGVEDGLLPHRRNDFERVDVEEERRLCFVGMTRAQRALTLTYAQWREVRGAGRRTTQSVFLTELPKEEIEWITLGERGGGGYDTRLDPKLEAILVEYRDWRKGEMVRHEEYGVGRLMWIQPTGGRLLAHVRFNTCGEKSLVLGKANLERVETDDLF